MTEREDEMIRRGIHDYAYAEPTRLDPAILRRSRADARRRQRYLRLATAAVVVLLIGGLALWIGLLRPTSVPPIDPTPTPTVTPTSEAAFAEQSRAQEDLPTGGLGSTVEGLQLTAIDIPEQVCGTSSRCPGDATLTVLNTTSEDIRAFVFFNVWRNNTPSISDSQPVSLAPGQSASVTIVTQPMLSDLEPAGSTGTLFSWNWSVELAK